jgi:hypothetical protein
MRSQARWSTLSNRRGNRKKLLGRGLPRAGKPVLDLADDRRPADGSNARGYLEVELAKWLVTENAWLGAVAGRAARIVSPLVTHPPRDAATA